MTKSPGFYSLVNVEEDEWDEVTATETPEGLEVDKIAGKKSKRSGEHVRAEFAKALAETKGTGTR